MTQSRFWSRFHARGVFWRQFIRWAAINVPIWMESIVIATWSGLFFFWPAGRRGVMRNLRAIHPRASTIGIALRALRVFWNFAWVLNDNIRFRALRIIPDWEFSGTEHFDEMQARPGGAILLTAHMGSYDLGAQLFAETSTRKIVMVRAPEVDNRTRAYEEQRQQTPEGLKINFNTSASELAFDLLEAVQRGEIVAIQGDRATPGVATYPATLFGKRARIPAGPFALAMAARVPIYPVFIVRRGRRRYRLVACAPLVVERRSRNRDEDLQRAIDGWSRELESVIRGGWYQWFAFDPFEEGATA